MSMSMHVFAVPSAKAETLANGGQSAIDDYLDDKLFASSETCAYLDKAWHAVDMLICTANGPGLYAGPLTMGGTPIGEDNGYGPPRLFSVAETKALAEQLAAHSDVSAHFDFGTFEREDIYPFIWDAENPEDREWVLASYGELRAVVMAAAARGDQLLVDLS